MTKTEHRWFILFAIMFLFGIGLAWIATRPVRAEGSTFIEVFRRAGEHSVFIQYTNSLSGASNSGWVTLSDIGSDYVCAKPQNGTFFCVPINSIVFVMIADTDSLPAEGQ